MGRSSAGVEGSRRHSSVVVLAGLLLLVVLGGSLMALIGAQRWLGAGEDVGPSLVRSGVQLAALSAVGALVTAALREVDREREAERREVEGERESARRTRERQERILGDLVKAYNTTKSVRRDLRALGLMRPPFEWRPEQVDLIRDRMDRLNIAQLSFEAAKREICNTRPFGDNDKIYEEVCAIEDHLNGILVSWEKTGSAFWEGRRGAIMSGPDQEALRRFIARTKDNRQEDPSFSRAVSDRLTNIERLIQVEIASSD